MEGTEVRSIKRLDGPTDRSTDPLNDRPSERTTARTTDRTSERKTDLPTETLAKRPAYDYLRFTNDIFGHVPATGVQSGYIELFWSSTEAPLN